ncbi:MAG: aminoglycoside phosphotransferase family protein [Oscillospiraceae bacterium]|jgi:aminoglycoside phosphotransferase (APT) family kinase protein|nr:aminoglycoside phosphotransferase family protein [Oscillospiraceae bacterium]
MELICSRPHKQIYRRGGDKIKLFSAEAHPADVLEEALNVELAQEAGLPVPPLHEVTKIDGQWAILQDFIEGETLQWHMEQDPARLAEWLALFVAVQTRVHAAQAPRLRRQKDQLHRGISASGLDATTRYELHIRLDAMPAHLKVCHGDFVPSNVLLRGGEAWIIDWAHVTQGNASADAANTYLSLLRQGGEPLAAAYLAQYCEQSDTARQYLQKWVPIIAAAHLSYCPPQERSFFLGFCGGIV